MTDEDAIASIKSSKVEASSNTFVAGAGDGVKELNTSEAPFGLVRSSDPDGWVATVATMNKRTMSPQSTFSSYDDIAKTIPAGKKWVDPNPPTRTADHVTKGLPLEWWFPEQIWGPEITP